MAEGEDVLRPVVARERRADGLHGGAASRIAVLGEVFRRLVAGHDRADDLHPGAPGNVGHDMMQLHVHLHERFLHPLHVRRRRVDQALAMTQVRPQSDDPLTRAKAPTQQSVLM